MGDAGSFGIRYSTKFESTYKAILRTHYRKNPKDRDEFEGLIDAVEEGLTVDPYLRGSVREPWPGNFGREGWDLCKYKFRMPGLKGAARHGRLLYLVDRRGREICFLWIYTHQEYENQPPTKDLKDVAKVFFRHFER